LRGLKFGPDAEIGKKEGFRSGTNYSAAIHQDGERPVLFVPYFFRELLGFLLKWQKLGLKAPNRLPVLTRKAFEVLIRKKGNVPSQKGFFATKTRPY
jgi:hypothetical protein